VLRLLCSPACVLRMLCSPACVLRMLCSPISLCTSAPLTVDSAVVWHHAGQ